MPAPTNSVWWSRWTLLSPRSPPSKRLLVPSSFRGGIQVDRVVSAARRRTPPEVKCFALQLGISAAVSRGCQQLVVLDLGYLIISSDFCSSSNIAYSPRPVLLILLLYLLIYLPSTYQFIYFLIKNLYSGARSQSARRIQTNVD
jgi:hypothetical protein